MKHPNIVIVKSDQHNARCLGVNGHPQVKTPHLDAIAESGVNFTRAFVQSPICSPSRMSYFSGQYPHNHGVYGLTGNETLPAGLPSMFGVFKDGGYRTGIIGHIHVKEEWLLPHCDMYRDLHLEGGSAYDAYLAKKGLAGMRDDEDYKGQPQIHDGCASELSFEDSYEGYCYQSFCEFLEGQPDGQPFLFELDSLHPHENYIPAKEFWDMYDGVELALPPSADEDLSDKPPNQQQRRREELAGRKLLFEPRTYQAGRLRKLQGYYGCITQVDHMVGLVRQKLMDMGEWENTVFIYCSDHGEFALEHGFLEKAPGISYDAVTRVPFIWSWPGGGFSHGTVEELVESVDVFPTLCKLTGLPAPDTIDGKDISAMLSGKVAPLRDFVVTEFPLSRVIRTKKWKLCHRPRGMFPDVDDAGELYHLTDDPWEMTNLYDDPKHRDIREQLRRRLFEWTQWHTRPGNALGGGPLGQDGKMTPQDLQRLVREGNVNYL